jgi:hypothetical protein
LRSEVGVVRIVEQEPQVIGVDLAQLGRSRNGYSRKKEEGESGKQFSVSLKEGNL